MPKNYINYDLIGNFNLADFQSKKPFPWVNFGSFLTADGFNELLNDYPDIELFEEHKDIKRRYGQEPHNRYYLAYQESIHHEHDYVGKGIAQLSDLPTSWQNFIEELETGAYKQFISTALGTSDFKPRLDWHIGVTHSEVSPHIDADAKIATHLFFFNSDRDWKPAWGGETLILNGKKSNVMNPDFDDFSEEMKIEILNNHSFFFQNTAQAWHGVKALTCPQGAYRKLFNVIFEFTNSQDQPLLYRAGLVE